VAAVPKSSTAQIKKKKTIAMWPFETSQFFAYLKAFIASRNFNLHITFQSKDKEQRYHMATWNVRTMLQPGKMQEVAQEMARYKIDNMALQEMK
jgi:hypothetical protein